MQADGRLVSQGLQPRYSGPLDALNKIVCTEGFGGLWKGVFPNVQRAFLVNMGELACYDHAKRFVIQNQMANDNIYAHTLASIMSGLSATTLSCPADVVKTRMMNQAAGKKGKIIYNSSYDCLVKTVRIEGLRALWKGFFPTWARRVPIMIRDSFPASGVVIMGSSNGLVCCRSRQTLEQPMLVIFICNPITREWISLRPTNCHVGHIFAFAFYPFGSSSNKASCFKVVSIQRQKYDQNSYSFVIYSSETGKWKTSMEVCHCEDDLNENKYIHIKGRFYWLTKKQRIITFDLEEELSGVIIAPGPMLRYGVRNSDCLGDSDGYLHYACVDESDLRVWMLKDCQKLDWVLKHQLNLDQFRVEGQVMTDYLQFSIRRVGCLPKDDIFAPGYLALGILTFYDEVIYMMRWGRLESYNFRNGVLKRHYMLHAPFLDHYNYVPATVLPYSATLAANGVLKVKQNSIDDLISVPATVLPCSATSAMSGLLGLIRSCGFVASNSSSYQGRRKRKRIKPVRAPHF